MSIDPKTIDPNKFKPVKKASADREAIRARFAAPPAPPSEVVTLDYGDGSAPFDVEVRTLTGQEKLALTDLALDAARAMAKARGLDLGEIQHVSLAKHTPATIAAATCVPGTDERVFSGPDDEFLAIMPPAVMERLGEVAHRLNRDTKEARDAAKNGSGGTPAATTSSPSPTS